MQGKKIWIWLHAKWLLQSRVNNKTNFQGRLELQLLLPEFGFTISWLFPIWKSSVGWYWAWESVLCPCTSYHVYYMHLSVSLPYLYVLFVLSCLSFQYVTTSRAKKIQYISDFPDQDWDCNLPFILDLIKRLVFVDLIHDLVVDTGQRYTCFECTCLCSMVLMPGLHWFGRQMCT